MAELMYREALNQALDEEMKRDPRVFLIGEEVARWFWGETAAGQLLRRVRDRLDAAPDPASKAAAFGVAR